MKVRSAFWKTGSDVVWNIGDILHDAMTPRVFLKQVLIMMTGKAGALLIALAVIPILSRLYAPADFGAVAVFLVLTNILTIVLPMRFFRASLIEQDDVASKMLLAMSAWLLVAGALFVASVIAYIEWTGITIDFLKPLGPFIWLLPVAVVLVGFAQILSTEHVKQSSFDVIAKSDVAESLISAVSRVTFGVIGASVSGLLGGYLTGSLGKLWFLMRQVTSPFQLLMMSLPADDVRRLAKEYDEYPKHSMPSGLLIAMSAKMPILLLASVYSPAIVGFYAMADRLVRAPVLLASSSVREVFLRKITGGRKRTTYLRPFSLMTAGMFLVGAIPFALMAYIGGDVLVFILGDNWSDAGVFVEILAPWYFSVWVITGVQPTLVAMRKQGVWLLLQVVVLMVRMAVLSTGFYVDVAIYDVLTWYAYANVAIAVFLLMITAMLMLRQQSSEPRAV